MIEIRYIYSVIQRERCVGYVPNTSNKKILTEGRVSADTATQF